MKFHLRFSIQGCQEIFSTVFYSVFVAPKSLCLCCHVGKKSQYRTTQAIREGTPGHWGLAGPQGSTELLPESLEFPHWIHLTPS